MSDRNIPTALGPGTVVLLVGPSGAGKDALLTEAMRLLRHDARFTFATRDITRPVHASEPFNSVTDVEFEAAASQGGYALHWRAHELGYGVPLHVDQDVAGGRIVIFNASRTAIPAARLRYANAKVVLVDCPLAIRASRIAARGREAETAIAARLARAVDGFDRKAVNAVIDNAGALEVATQALVTLLLSYAGHVTASDYRKT